MSNGYFDTRLYDNLNERIKTFNTKMSELGSTDTTSIYVVNKDFAELGELINKVLPEVWDTEHGREIIKKMSKVYEDGKRFWDDGMYINFVPYQATRLYMDTKTITKDVDSL